MIHILPNIGLCQLYEPFVCWDEAKNEPLHQIQKAYETTVGLLHLIPSNLDVSLIMSPMMAL